MSYSIQDVQKTTVHQSRFPQHHYCLTSAGQRVPLVLVRYAESKQGPFMQQFDRVQTVANVKIGRFRQDVH